MTTRLVRALMAVALLFAVVATGTAAAPQADDARSDHQKTVDYWTAERVRQAIPRDFVFDLARGRFIPAAPGGVPGPPDGAGGGGGGGDDSTSTTGATWTDKEAVVYNATGKVLFTLGGTDYVCSASVVTDETDGRSLAVTAGHCVYENAGSPEFASNFMYIPRYADVAKDLHILNDNAEVCDQALYGCWTASALVVHDGFASAGGFNGTAIQYDFAFAVLDSGLESHGAQNIDFSAVSKGTATYSFGYPNDFEAFNHDLIYCADGVSFDNRLFSLTYKLKCDMTGGASGGPWFAPFTPGDGTGTVISVNSYRYTRGNAMYGPKFNSNTADVYEAAKGATTDTIVGG